MNILVDTREKQPWTFASGSAILIPQKLDTGDYTVEGLEDKLCIERKKSVAELAHNIVDKRFDAELQRMTQFPHSFIILEFDYRHIDDYPEGSSIPRSVQKKIKIKGSFIIKRLSEIQLTYNIHVIPCSNLVYAEHIAYSLMKNVYERYL